MPPTANAFVPAYNTAFTAPMSERRTDWRRVCFKQYELGLNEYDACLMQEKMVWDEIIQSGGLQTICCPQGRPKYPRRPWQDMPKEGRRFKPISTLLVSSAIPFTGLDVLVMSERVPVGYDGVISDVVCEITANGATGFVDGSGDITWRLSADNRWLRDMGNLKVQVGSLTHPSPVPRGMLRVYSHDLIQFFVNFAVGAEAVINPNAYIVCSVTGWFYPR
jgi:hypothetical protein